MSDGNLFEVMASFFDDLPDVVRAEISLLLVALADDQAIDIEGWSDREADARAQFDSQSRFGRLGELIKAIGILDAYFAADPRERLAPIEGAAHGRRSRDPPSAMWRSRFSQRLSAIEQARSDWQDLRRTGLATEAISKALIPQFAARPRRRRNSNAPSPERIERASQ